ncbi:MAG: oxygen-independent coproporphyrinogen III oxidase [Flavobacteriales bacterium]|nr:oxygen-independent coproporphyrinogen III oxidase [Flavobacteriales bacterium]
METSLIRKYNVPGPRYTSYPTVPYWESDGFGKNDWLTSLKKTFEATNQSDGISLYIHLPYCEALCHYCGCNKKITTQHSVEAPYITRVLNEWKLYCDLLSQKPRIKELHLGGGTPTFFSAENLKILIEGLLKYAEKTAKHEFSFEAHPSSTTRDKMQVLFDLGFKRLSLGVQDFTPEVQRVINRYQSYEEVEAVSQIAREIGYTSINFDLIFGLPKQTLNSIEDTILKTIALKPDRIAYYSYAHVPWVSKAQRLYSDEDLPDNDYKRSLYELGKKLLEEHQYLEIGMDHFALPNDDLTISYKNRELHRNFMGYTSAHTQVMIGLGVSSISDSWNAFAQNVKTLKEYERLIDQNEIPVFKGHLLSDEDLMLRKHILNLMCSFETSWNPTQNEWLPLSDIKNRLAEMEADGLLVLLENGVTVTEKGKPFVRNICMAFDLRLYRNQPTTPIFSQTV